MKRSNAFTQAGVTLTELLVVLVIVSILSTIAVPVYINKAENARKATAQVECREIAEAEETCASYHGYYVPLQLLDDLPAGATNRSGVEADSIENEVSVYLIDPSRAFSHLQDNASELLIPAIGNVQANNSLRVSGSPRVLSLVRNWQGPFLNPQRVFKGDIATNNPGSYYDKDVIRKDYPLDPWGNPYRFYAPEPFGVIGTKAWSTDNLDLYSSTFSDGAVTEVDNLRGFDRFAIVSYGPNGVSDTYPTQTFRSDDIVYYFGRANAVQNETIYSAPTSQVTPTP